MYEGCDHDQSIQEGYRDHREGERQERETRGAKAKSVSKRTEADKFHYDTSLLTGATP